MPAALDNRIEKEHQEALDKGRKIAICIIIATNNWAFHMALTTFPWIFHKTIQEDGSKIFKGPALDFGPFYFWFRRKVCQPI